MNIPISTIEAVTHISTSMGVPRVSWTLRLSLFGRTHVPSSCGVVLRGQDILAPQALAATTFTQLKVEMGRQNDTFKNIRCLL